MVQGHRRDTPGGELPGGQERPPWGAWGVRSFLQCYVNRGILVLRVFFGVLLLEEGSSECVGRGLGPAEGCSLVRGGARAVGEE